GGCDLEGLVHDRLGRVTPACDHRGDVEDRNASGHQEITVLRRAAWSSTDHPLEAATSVAASYTRLRRVCPLHRAVAGPAGSRDGPPPVSADRSVPLAVGQTAHPRWCRRVERLAFPLVRAIRRLTVRPVLPEQLA